MKKGQITGYKQIYFIVALFAIAFMFVYLHQSFKQFSQESVECTSEAYQEIMIAKILYSDCFTYKDPDIKAVIPGTIDKSKFTQENYNNCFNFLIKKTNLTLEDISVGEPIYDPLIINKTIWLYDNDQKISKILTFRFEESEC
jgi:hypothetical protein